MKKKNVVIRTLSEDVFADIETKLENLGATIVEERYDLLYHRYELYVKANLLQSYKLYRFIKSLDANIIKLES